MLPDLLGLSDVWVEPSSLSPCCDPVALVPFPLHRLGADLLSMVLALLTPHEGSFVARVCKVSRGQMPFEWA